MNEQEIIEHISKAHQHVSILSRMMAELLPKKPLFHETVLQLNTTSAQTFPVNIPFKATYVNVINQSSATLYLTDHNTQTQPITAKPIPSGSVSLRIMETQQMTIFQSAAVAGSNVVILQFSDRPFPTSVDSNEMSLTGSNTTNLVLASHVTATGDGTPQPVNGYSGMRLNIWGDTGVTYSVNIVGQMDDGNWYTLPTTSVTTAGATATTAAITTAGIYDIDVSNFTQVALLVNSLSGQSSGVGVNAKGGFQV